MCIQATKTKEVKADPDGAMSDNTDSKEDPEWTVTPPKKRKRKRRHGAIVQEEEARQMFRVVGATHTEAGQETYLEPPGPTKLQIMRQTMQVR